MRVISLEMINVLYNCFIDGLQTYHSNIMRIDSALSKFVLTSNRSNLQY